MDKYLLEILKEVKTIIIPGLGALTITNAETGEIMFMSYLKHDDGKLVGYIVNKEGIDENEAKNQIAKYVRQIHTALDKGESYDMFKFGSFIKKNDEIDFKNLEKSSAKAAPIKKEIEKPEVKKVAEKKVDVAQDSKSSATQDSKSSATQDSNPIEIGSSATQDDKVKATVSTEKAAEEKKTDDKKVEDKAPEKTSKEKVTPKKESDVKREMNVAQKEELAATTAKMNKLKDKKDGKPQKKKRGIGFWILMGLIVIIVAGGTFVGLNYDAVKQHIPFLADNSEKKEKAEKKSPKDKMKEILGQGGQEEVDEGSENEVMEESFEGEVTDEDVIAQIEDEKVQEVKPPVTQTNSSDDLPFHIIAGAFSSEANANRLADNLREKGYATSVSMGKGMHLVSIKSYSSKAEAQAGLSEVKADAPKAWVYEKP